MSTVINTNMASLFAQNSLANAQNNLATSVQRLSSGLRINSAKDDAAGLAISQSMQSQINGTNQSIRNLSDATNLLQTADTSLSVIQDMLLRLKQLAVQGFDGSLSATQKLDIVTEMKDLNSEINSTAKRTSFNGINLLSSAAGIDSTNSDIYGGQDLVLTAASITTSTGLGTSGTLSSADASTYTLSVTSEFKSRMAGLVYTFSNAGADLTMTGTLDGQAISQTVTVQPVTGQSSTSDIRPQTLDFSSFGTTIVLNTAMTNINTQDGSVIATGLTTAASSGGLTLAGVTGQISNVSLSGVGAGSYVITNSGADVTMAGTISGMATSQTLTLSTVTANTTTKFNFSSFGVSFDIQAYGKDLVGSSLATTLTGLDGGTTSASTGVIVISSGQNSALKFQSGATSEAYITVDTVNVMTGSTGTTAGATNQMKAVGTAITGTASSYLGSLNATNTLDTWQNAFKAAETAIDTALDFISTQRAVYGSQMNRLNYVSSNLNSQSINLQNSRSAIIDTDFAAETAKLTKGQIMQQAATAMLAQANQMPNVVLSLLK